IFADADVAGVKIGNRLAFDVEFYAKKLLAETEKEIGHLYPADQKGNKPIAYYWARVGTCSNPSCKAEVPLLRQFYLSKRRGTTEKTWTYLKPILDGNQIDFEIANGECAEEGWMERANLRCPCCGSITEVKKLKEQFKLKLIKEKIIAVIEGTGEGKLFRLPYQYELEAACKSNTIASEVPFGLMPKNDSQNVKIPLWGFQTWGEMFSTRQLEFQYEIVKNLNSLKASIVTIYGADYSKALVTYLAILIDRISVRNNTFCRWHIQQDTIEHPFSRQAIPMMFDYPEMNPFGSFSGSAIGQLQSILEVIKEQGQDKFSSNCNNSASGIKNQFGPKYLDIVVTDPPYYDAIAYADLSDFFYEWLKRTLSDLFPLNFSTPQTPKSEECTAIKHHHSGDINKAKYHFESTLQSIFTVIEFQTKDLVSIMFAHQSTEAWTTLCNSILNSKMNITGSWAIDTEMAARMMSIGNAALESSVTVSCRPAQRHGYGNYKEVKKAIEITVAKEVDELYRLGFRGADLLTACFGQAVSEFGKYEKVEKADGSEVTVAELLEMARESAFNALLKGFAGDDFTKFYIGWLQLYGFAESDFDDAAKFSRVGLSINVQELFAQHLLIKHQSKQTLAGYKDRIDLNKHLGDKTGSLLIDEVHKAMSLYEGTNRNALLQYIAKVDGDPESNFWRVITSLCEILPAGSDDHKQGMGLLTNKDSLIRESKAITIEKTAQTTLEL
ncbi:MAG TPA: hypothetical protein VFE54_08460, partial [Mucilaginibacter sp.]|nr:hypothetical protein [Mucilaginibacter sp.]